MSEESEIVQSRVGAHIAIVTLNRPRYANAVSPELTAELGRAVMEIESDREVRCAILAAAGDRAFCAGADLAAIAAGKRDLLYTEAGGFGGFATASRGKFWIACVEAPALAGGLELALACDMIVASRKAGFGLPEVSRALIAAAGGLVRLPRALPRGLALEMIATGAPISAERAYETGLVNYLVEPGGAYAKAVEVAELIARNAPLAVRESLAVARVVYDHGEADLMRLSSAAARRNYLTEDFKEGPRAFLEKRAPVWAGA